MPLDSHQEGRGPRDLRFTIDQEPEYSQDFLYHALRVIRLLFEVFQENNLAYTSDPVLPGYDPWVTVRFCVAPQVAKACYEAIPETFMENDFDAQAVIAEKLETLIFSRIMSSDLVSAALTNCTATVTTWADHSTILRLFPRDEIPRLRTLSNAEREAHLVKLYQPVILEPWTHSRQYKNWSEYSPILQAIWMLLSYELPPLCGVSQGAPVTGVPFVHFYPFALEVNKDRTLVQGSFPMGVGLTLTPPCDPTTWELSSDPQAFWKKLFALLDNTIEGFQDLISNRVQNTLTPPTTSPRLFLAGNIQPMASSLMVWEGSSILTQGKLLPWKPDDEHKLTYGRAVQQGRGQLIFQITDMPEAQAPESLAGPAAWTVLETFDIRAACMHLIYAAHVAELERPWADEFIIDDTDIAYYLGLDKRTDWTRDEKLALIERLIWQPAQLLVYLYWPPQGKLDAFALEKSKLWDIAVTYHGQINLFDRKGTGLTVRGRAGLWAKHFLNRQGQKDGHARLEYGFLTQRLLHTVMSCWQTHAGAARLMVWLLFKSRVGKDQRLSVETLLEVAYGQDIISTAQHDRRQRHTLATCWDGDLLILQEQGWHIQFDPVTYPPDIQPNWAGRGTQARPNHWWARLQQARLSILPPPELDTALAQLGKPTRPHPQKRIRVQVSPPTKEVIREARIRCGWRQVDLAEAMGKSRQWVGMIENGERRVTPEELPRLCQILHLPPTGK